MRASTMGAALAFGACAVAAQGPDVAPTAEQERARAAGAAGPVASRGIEAMHTLGTVALAGTLTAPGNRVMRLREIVVAPGGVIGVHQHDGRPGLAYIMEGEMTEFRSPKPRPVVKRAGDVALEEDGITHWWENRGTKPARALVVDIVPAPNQ